MRRYRRAVLVAAALVASLSLAGCVQSATPAPATTKSTHATASPTPTATPDPVFHPNGTADENKAYFDLVNTRFFTANPSALGRPIIDNLVAAGFSKADMQVTPDKTSIGGGVDSILFAVKMGNECLLGQHGGGGYSSSVAAALTTGGPCLIGLTRSIDW
jgi:opacity protein-like surface antigen